MGVYEVIREKTKELGVEGKDGKPKYVIMPIDHLFSDGTMEGLTTVKQIKSVLESVKEHTTSIIAHIGTVRDFRKYMKNPIVHLSGQTSLYEEHSEGRRSKTLVTNMEEVLEVDAKAASVHINWGSEHEPQMLRDLRIVKRGCLRYRIPLLFMNYVRWKTKEEGGTYLGEEEYNEKNIRKAVVAACCAGADIIKTPYSGDVASFKKVTQSVSVPVVIAGGPKKETVKDVLETVKGAMKAGASGMSLGRNVFQAPNPKNMAHALYDIIVKDASVKDAEKLLEQ